MRLIVIGKITPVPPPISIIPSKNAGKLGKTPRTMIPAEIISEVDTNILFSPNLK
jgi:hypothetical protein